MIDLSRHAGSSMAVFGLGKSGISTSLALAAGGAEVSAWDDDPARRRHAAELGRYAQRPLPASSGKAFAGLC